VPRPSSALSHQPFLLPITWLTVGLGFNKFKALASRQEAARKAFLARCDNAPQRYRSMDRTCGSSHQTRRPAPALHISRGAPIPRARSDFCGKESCDGRASCLFLRTKGIGPQFPNGVVSSVSFVSTTNTARSWAGSVSLALALTLWRSPGSSEKLSPAL
jgi:hypothetical protein